MSMTPIPNSPDDTTPKPKEPFDLSRLIASPQFKEGFRKMVKEEREKYYGPSFQIPEPDPSK